MANELQIFRNEEFGEIRVIEINEEPWFIAGDICKALDIQPTATRRLDKDEKNTLRLTQGIKGNPNVTIVSEAGLYNLILASRKTEAKQFKRWVTHEVLPSIRRNGGYIQTTPNMTDDEIMARAVLIGQKKIEEQAKRIEEMRPKEIFADRVTASTTSIPVGDLAKLLKQNGIDIGQKRLFEWLRNHGYLVKYGRSYNVPTQYSMDLGLMELEEKVVRKDNERYIINKISKITSKGQQYFINKFLNENLVS